MSIPVPDDSWYEPDDPSALPDNMVCSWCGNCMIPPDEASEYGWCLINNDWTPLDERVTLLDCDYVLI